MQTSSFAEPAIDFDDGLIFSPAQNTRNGAGREDFEDEDRHAFSFRQDSHRNRFKRDRSFSGEYIVSNDGDDSMILD